MKNPFLQDRNIFSKVQKPIPKINKQQKQLNNPQQIKTQYQPKYNVPVQNKQSITSPNTVSNNLGYGTYKKQSFNSNSNQPSINANKYMSSQKITFGDPLSSQAYHGERTSGYFNMLNSQQQTSKPLVQNQYQNLKYEPRKNNFFEADNRNTVKQHFAVSINMNEPKQQFGKNYGNYTQPTDSQLDYQFAPPPINNFGTNNLETKYQQKNYQYKPSLQNGHQKKYTTYSQQNQKGLYQGVNEQIYNQAKYAQINAYTAQTNIYKSPPKQSHIPFASKNDISTRFRQNNYAQFSPIGQVSRHKINQDSIMNLDGLMEGTDFDKLLAESKTQQELLKILGMDTSMIKKNTDSENKNKFDYLPKYQNYELKYQNNEPKKMPSAHIETNKYQFNKKNYEPQSSSQKNELKYQNFADQNDEPQVFNYGQSYIKKTQQQIRPSNNFRKILNQSPPKFNKQTNKPFKQSLDNYFVQPQLKQQKIRKSIANEQRKNSQDQADLQQIMQSQMQKFMLQQQGFGRDKRVFMTANQKIITKKYKLLSL